MKVFLSIICLIITGCQSTMQAECAAVKGTFTQGTAHRYLDSMGNNPTGNIKKTTCYYNPANGTLSGRWE